MKKLLSKIGITFFRLSLLLMVVGIISNSVTGGTNALSNVVQHILYFTATASLLYFAKYRISLSDLLWAALLLSLATGGVTIGLYVLSLVLYVVGSAEYPGAIAYVPWWIIVTLIAMEVLAFRSRTLREKLFD